MYNANENLIRRLRHLLESDFIRSFDEKNPITGEYKRDIKEADKLQRFATMESKGFKATIERLEDLILDRKSIISECDNEYAAENNEIYKKDLTADITALETAIISVKFHDDMKNEYYMLINDLEQEKEKNRLLKRAMLSKDACIDMQIQAIERLQTKLNDLREVLEND